MMYSFLKKKNPEVSLLSVLIFLGIGYIIPGGRHGPYEALEGSVVDSLVGSLVGGSCGPTIDLSMPSSLPFTSLAARR